MTVTLAIDRYDRLMPFHDGTVELPSGLDLKVLQVGQEGRLRDGAHRHERMLQQGEFDAAEVSLSSYVAGCARGLPFTAIPVFPRRLFSLGQVFVNTRSSFSHPRELAGRTIGLQSFQTTLAVLAKGDMAAEYGLDLRSVRWLTRSAETVEVAPATEFRVGKLPAGLGLVEALVQGEVDAIFYSRTPWRDPDASLPIRRLFADPQASLTATSTIPDGRGSPGPNTRARARRRCSVRDYGRSAWPPIAPILSDSPATHTTRGSSTAGLRWKNCSTDRCTERDGRPGVGISDQCIIARSAGTAFRQSGAPRANKPSCDDHRRETRVDIVHP
jgi:hypothetical protein